MTQRVHYEKDGEISIIRLDDGKANALSPAMWEELNAALDQAEADGTAVLITGREGMFSGGFDLKVFQAGGKPIAEMLLRGARTCERLLAFPAPVVMACSGHAIAMGVFLLQSADLRIGIDDSSYRLHINEAALGMPMPHYPLALCQARLTPAAFNHAITTATPYPPAAAVQAGMLDEIVAGEQLMDTALERTRALAALPREALITTRQRTRQPVLTALAEAIAKDEADLKAFFGD